MDNIYWTSFKTFFKIGAFTLGGGYAMIPIIEEEVVNKNKWVSHEEMLDLIAVAQTCPGAVSYTHLNPEMQKRAYNLVRALVEEDNNPVVSIHDHGSAGHLNCLSELVEECGGEIDMSKLPIGDKTLSAKEIIANESQERMGLLIDEKHLEPVSYTHLTLGKKIACKDSC